MPKEKEIYKKYIVRLYRYFYVRVNNRELAEDLTSDVLTKVCINIEKFDFRKNMDAWIFTIARNTLIDYFRQYGRNKEICCEDMENEEDKGRFEDDVEMEFFTEKVVEVMKDLSSVERDVIEMTYFAQLDSKEIGKVLEKSTGNVRIIRHRALKKIKELLKNDTEE